MRKLYSLVLLAVGLLIGTNAWGQFSTVQLVNHTNPSASKGYATLQDAIDAVAPGDTATITLLEEQNLTASIVIPNAVGESAQTFAARGKVVGRQPQRICLNLNGNDIVGDGALNQCCIALLKGVLHITGEGEIIKQGTEKGSYSGWGRAAIAVSGAPGDKKTPDNDHSKDGWWSTLIIDENVKVTAPDNFQSVGLAIMNIGGYIGNSFYNNQNTPAFIGVRQKSTTNNPTTDADDKLGYQCYNSTTAATIPDAIDLMWSRSNLNVSGKSKEQGSAFGVRVVVKGEIYGMNRGIFVYGNINQKPDDFPVIQSGESHKETRTRYTIGNDHPYYYEHYFPWITIEKTAKVRCKDSGTDDQESGGIYAAGWAVWDISGEVYGQNGMFIRSGDIKLNDANVYSRDNSYGNDGWRNGNVAGNGIFITTDQGYANDTKVEVNGDSRIAGNGGAAIVEVVASTGTTPDVKNITINGGTIEGGSTGAIMVTEKTGDNTVAYGGTNITGITTKGGTESSVAATGTYATEVTDPQTNKTTIVISDLGAGNSVETVTENLAQTTEDYVKWTGTADQYILTDMTLEYLEMNPSPAVAQKIYVGDATHQATLTVDRVVMGSLAQIIVAPGSSLVVKGEDGIVAPNVNNIVLNSTATKQAYFLFNPNVSSNKYPKATVKLTSKAYKKGEDNYAWQRFAVPTHFSNDEAKILHRNDMEYDKVTYPTAIYKRVYSPDGWQVLAPAANDAFEPFMCYNMTTNVGTKNPVYTFKCELAGNVNAELPIVGEKWNYYGNSYTAPIYLASMLPDLPAHISKIVYVHNGEEDKWDAVSLADAEEDEMLQSRIMPMQAFVFRKQADAASSTLKYKEWIYDPAIADPALAPARHANVAKDYQRASIVMQAEEGSQEMVKLYLGSNFDNAYNDGYDVEKLMSENHFNMFIAAEEGNMARLASDNIENIAIDMQTKEATSYTMSLKNVTLEGYAIKDNVTGTTVEIAEGNFYHFSTLANANVEGRFEVVPVAKMPTAIENTEVKANAKGIFTLTGQYLGEDFNAIPAGIYIVNGKKMVK